MNRKVYRFFCFMILIVAIVGFVGSGIYQFGFYERSMDNCEKGFVGCDVWNCKAKLTHSYNMKNYYLLEEQNCLLKQQQTTGGF